MSNEQLFPFIQRYGLLAPVDESLWPLDTSTEDIQDYLIKHILTSVHFETYPPSKTYQRKFWKWTIEKIEELGKEVDERIYDNYLNLLSDNSCSNNQPPSPSYVSYIWNPPSKLPINKYELCTLYESHTMVESGTTGLTTWNASFVLADYLIKRLGLIVNSKVLELGSGAGFLGTVVGHMQMSSNDLRMNEQTVPNFIAASLCLTDANEQVLVRCRNNVMLPCNKASLHPSLTVKLLDWTDALDNDRKYRLREFLTDADPDLIIGADLVYDTTIIPSLVATLKLALELPSLRVDSLPRKAIIAGTVRNEATLDEFIRQCEAVAIVNEERALESDAFFKELCVKQPGVRHMETGDVRIFVLTRRK